MHSRHLVLPALALALITGCAQSSGTTPTLPAGAGSETNPFGPDVVLDGMATGALGALNVSIDPATLEILTSPVVSRETAGQGDIFHLSIRPFLQPRNLRVTGIALNGDGNIEVSVLLTHPFAAPADLNPPVSATKRVDLHVFDVNGILVADGSDEFFGGDVKTNASLLMNADGYRDPGILFDKTQFGIPASGANVFAYKLFAQGIDTTQPQSNQGNYDPTTHGWQGNALLAPLGFDVFPQGGSAEVVYELAIPGSGSIDFALVVTAKYQDPRSAGQGRTKRLPTGNPLDLRYILPEASGDLHRITWEVSGTLRDDQSTDIATITAQILDWDHDATVATTFPNDADLNQVREDSSIALIDADFPDLRGSGTYNGNAVTQVPGNPVLWETQVSVTNEDLFDAIPGGEFVAGMIRVQDSQDLDDQSPTGIKPFVLNEASTVPVAGATLSSTRYQVVRVLVEDFNTNSPPGPTTFTFPPVAYTGVPYGIDLDSAVPPLSSLDPDGLSLFEVDWDNNGTWDDSITVTTGDSSPDFTTTFAVVNPAQEFRIRITDDYDPPSGQASTVYGPFTVDVQDGSAPVTPVVGPSAPIAPTQPQATFSFQYDRFMQPLATDGSGNVYVAYRPASLVCTIVRSADNGNNWGTPVNLTDGVTPVNSSNGLSLATLADGSVAVAAIPSGSAGAVANLAYVRCTPSGVDGVTVGTVHIVSALMEWRDPVIVADATDASKAWIFAQQDPTTANSDDSLVVFAVTGADTATPVFTITGQMDPPSHNGNIADPKAVMGNGGIIHTIYSRIHNGTQGTVPDNGVYYRGYDSNTNTVLGLAERVSDPAWTFVSIHGSITTDLNGNPVVVHDESNTTSLDSNVWLSKRVSGVWSAPVQVTGTEIGQFSPTIDRGPGGRLLMIWRDSRVSANPASLWGRVYNDNLTPASAEFEVDPPVDHSLHPKVVYTGSGTTFTMVFYDSTGSTSFPRIKRRMISW